jgi:hypothetical protein
MNSILPKSVSPSHLGNLPGPARGGLAILSGGGIMTAVWFGTNGNTTAMLIVGLGLVAVAILVAAYKAVLGWFQKRRAAPLAQGLAGNAAAAPQGISEPARRARLDDLRRNFDQGVEKFRAAGKNMYSVPWYVLVGEPGSGKTEAIRHCNVGFPPGLQDQLQGAGGTLNMNWWFTNSAIILDTAGRLMFEEVVPGSTNEWNEFLNLLKRNRPNCPINGMLLVIPVDTLIKDTADQIEKKAGKIAQQFDQIQRTLGVRFPVFVIITKCDLLNGFREFFDDLNDPQLQHQMMGWSNPADLDAKFESSAVVNHLETVKQRLLERRRQLLLDPVNTEDANARRTDQVDALYALPDALMKIAPRLKRYLEMIFVAGEWSPKPLFLRGIYFTSSMTEGSALDAELAEVLGVAVDSLPEGRVWRRDRAYFLRDLFIEKVFRERGLVTRASNANKQQRTRRMIVLTSGFLAVIALGVFTWFGARQLENTIGKHRDFWADAASDSIKTLAVVNPTNDTYQDNDVNVGHVHGDTAQMFARNLPLMQSPIRIPIIYAPLAKLSGDPNKERLKAYRALYEATVLYPVFEAARAQVKNTDASNWNESAVAALAQLMRAQYAVATKGGTPTGEVHPAIDLDPLFKFALADPKEVAKYQPDSQALQSVADWIYSPDANGTAEWPPAAVAAGGGDALSAVDDGIKKTLDYWDHQTSGNGAAIAAIDKVKTALEAFRTAEDNLVALKAHPIESRETYFPFAASWKANYDALQQAKADAAAAWIAATKATGADPEKATLSGLYSAEINRVAANAEKDYDTLLRYTVDKQPAADASRAANDLYSYNVKLKAARDQLENWKSLPDSKTKLAAYTDLDKSCLDMIKGTDDTRHHRFEVAAQVFQIANPFILQKGPPSDPTPITGPLSAALDQADHSLTDADNVIQKITLETGDAADRLALDCAAATFAVDTGTRNKRWMLTMGAMKGMPDDAASPGLWTPYIQQLAAKFPKDNLLRPELPLVNEPDPLKPDPKAANKYFSAQYSPDAVGAVTEVLDSTTKITADPAKVLDSSAVRAEDEAIQKPFNIYRDSYRTYWTETVFHDELVPHARDWADFSQNIAAMRERTLRGALKDYGTKVAQSLDNGNFHTEANAVKLDLQKQDASGFQDEAQAVLTAWKNLGDNSVQARRTILVMEPGNFSDNYVLGTSKDLDNFVYRYWHSVCVEGLRVLADAGQDDITAGLTQLRQYEHFPLADPTNAHPDLSLQDLLNARAAVERIRGAVPGLTATSADAAKTIAQGANTRDKEVDAQLDRLRGTQTLRPYLTYLDNLSKMFNALPTGQQPMTCTLTVLKDKMKDSDSIALKYTYMNITQGNAPAREAFLGGANVVDQFDVKYAGDDLVFQFRDVPGGPIRQTVTFPGPWSPLRMLKDPLVKSVDHTGSKWTVELSITPTGSTTAYPLWVGLEFKAEVPDLKNWPVPPANQ